MRAMIAANKNQCMKIPSPNTKTPTAHEAINITVITFRISPTT